MALPLYLIDEENVSFQPRTYNEAIILFNRMKRKNQVQWEYVPELLQKLAAGLGPEDHDRFCEWICNPCEIKPGPPGYFASLCKADRGAILAKDEPVEQKVPDDPDTPLEASDQKLGGHNIVYESYIGTGSGCTSGEQCTLSELP